MTPHQHAKIVKSDRVHVFADRGWDSELFDAPGLYAIGFPNGVVKFGRSKKLRQRVKNYDITGSAMVANFFLFRKHPTPNSAEREILARARALFQTAGAPECFYCSREEAVKIMCSDSEPQHKTVPCEGGYEFEAKVVLGDGRVLSMNEYMFEFIDTPLLDLFFTMELERASDALIDAIVGSMDARYLMLFKMLSERNAVLVGRGLNFPERRTIIEQFAIDLRSEGVQLIK